MSVLDYEITYKSLDPSNMGQRLQSFPQQCVNAWEQSTQLFELHSRYKDIDDIVILGMGGSAIGAELLVDLATVEKTPPIRIHRNYGLPNHVTKNTLVIASSNSGRTTETLSGFNQAINIGAKVITITAGSDMALQAESAGSPVLKVNYQGEPRTALGYSFLAPLGIMVQLNLIRDISSEIEESVNELSKLVRTEIGMDVLRENNRSKQLAHFFLSRLPVVYGGGIFTGVAHRWKTQLNENSKVWAQWEVLPEANHNAVVGYLMPQAVKELAFVLFLKPHNLPTEMSARYDVTQELMVNQGVDNQTIEGYGNSALSQILTTSLVGDYTSYYLALLQGIDPSPIPPIDFIKDRLSRRR